MLLSPAMQTREVMQWYREGIVNRELERLCVWRVWRRRDFQHRLCEFQSERSHDFETTKKFPSSKRVRWRWSLELWSPCSVLKGVVSSSACHRAVAAVSSTARSHGIPQSQASDRTVGNNLIWLHTGWWCVSSANICFVKPKAWLHIRVSEHQRHLSLFTILSPAPRPAFIYYQLG